MDEATRVPPLVGAPFKLAPLLVIEEVSPEEPGELLRVDSLLIPYSLAVALEFSLCVIRYASELVLGVAASERADREAA